MSATPFVLSAPVEPARYERKLTPVFLIAATINTRGNIDLPVVHHGRAEPSTRVEFSLGSCGELYQQRYSIGAPEHQGQVMRIRMGEQEPMDMAFLGDCLAAVLGPLTPPAFRLGEPGTLPRRFELSGDRYDHERLKLLHEAFSTYLLAFEERLV